MRHLLCIILILSCGTIALAQNAGGGTGTVGSVTLSWSVGEIGGGSLLGSETIITPGPIQPRNYEFSPTEWRIPEVLFAFPNPVTDQLTIRWSVEFGEARGTLRLYNAQGLKVWEQPWMEVIQLDNLTPGIYLLEATTDQNHRAVVRIWKE